MPDENRDPRVSIRPVLSRPEQRNQQNSGHHQNSQLLRGLPREFIFVQSGEFMDNFEEVYISELTPREGSRGNLAPHYKGFRFRGGHFDQYTISIPLFSGRDYRAGVLNTGREIKREAELLSNLAKPLTYSGDGNSRSIGPPLCRVTIENFWSAIGYFSESRVSPRPIYDRDKLPLFIDVRLTFQRHVRPDRAIGNPRDFTNYLAGNYSFGVAVGARSNRN